MTFKTKRRIKFSLSLVVLFAGFCVFSLLVAGFYAIGLSMMGVAVFSRSLWPEIWGGDELSAKHQNYAFGGALMLGVAVLLLAGLKRLSDARSSERESPSEALRVTLALSPLRL